MFGFNCSKSHGARCNTNGIRISATQKCILFACVTVYFLKFNKITGFSMSNVVFHVYTIAALPTLYASLNINKPNVIVVS